MPTPESPSPEEEARLRRLLAEARETGPIPDEVAERLDATLAELGVEGSGARDADVVPMDRRRPRTVAGILAAAAVVVVAGVGVQQVLTDGGAGDALLSSEATTGLDRDDRAGADEVASAEDGDAAGAEAPEAVTGQPLNDLQVREFDTGIARIRNQELEQDALAVRRALPVDAAERYDGAVLYAAPGFTCAPADWGSGVLVGVRYDGQPAVLAFREPSKQNQVAEVLQCGTGDGLRSVTLSAP